MEEAALKRLSWELRELDVGFDVPRISWPIPPDEFFREWVAPNKPVILTGAIDHWPALKKWTLEYLDQSHGATPVTVAYTPNGRADAVTKLPTPLPGRHALGTMPPTAATAAATTTIAPGPQAAENAAAATASAGAAAGREWAERPIEQAAAALNLHDPLPTPSLNPGPAAASPAAAAAASPAAAAAPAAAATSPFAPAAMPPAAPAATSTSNPVADIMPTTGPPSSADAAHLHGNGCSCNGCCCFALPYEQVEPLSNLLSLLRAQAGEAGGAAEGSSYRSGGVGSGGAGSGGSGGVGPNAGSSGVSSGVAGGGSAASAAGGCQPGCVAYMQRQNGNLLEELPCLLPDVEPQLHGSWAQRALGGALEASNVWVGNRHSLTSFHKDHYENLYCVLAGEKVFTLLPPSDVYRMYQRPYRMARYVRADGSDGSGGTGADAGAGPAAATSAGRAAAAAEEGGGHQPSGGVVAEPRLAQAGVLRTQPPLLRLEMDETAKPVLWSPVEASGGGGAPSNPRQRQRHPLFFGGGLPAALTCSVRAGEVLYLPSMWWHQVAQRDDQEGKVVAVNYWHEMRFNDLRYAYYTLVEGLARGAGLLGHLPGSGGSGPTEAGDGSGEEEQQGDEEEDDSDSGSELGYTTCHIAVEE